MIIANWKANGGRKSNKDWSTIFLNSLSKEVTSSIGIAPSHIHFMQLLDIFKNSSLKIGLQDVDFENGARTGSISASMASEMNCSFSILGHSERRTLFNEDNKLIDIAWNEIIKCGIINSETKYETSKVLKITKKLDITCMDFTMSKIIFQQVIG